MRKLIIHAGTHKTGTKSVQRALFEGRDALEKAGVHFFCAHKSGTNLKANAGKWVPNEGSGPEFRAWIDSRLAPRLAKSPGEMVVISAESFSYINSYDTLASFRDQLTQSFSSIQIIFYLRRQDQLAVSHYQQAAKWRSTSAGRFYGHAAKALPEYAPHFESYFDYNRKIGLWQSVFGEDCVTARLFERSLLKDQCAVSDFMQQSELPIQARAINENESRGRERTLVGHMMHAAGVPRSLQAEIDSRLNDDGRLLPSKNEARAFYDRYRASNRALNDKLNISNEPDLFNDDFSGYPDVANDTWSNETATATLANLFTALKSLPSYEQRSFDMLFEAATALRKTNPRLAHQLLGQALHLRPRNRNARRMFEELGAGIERKTNQSSSAARMFSSLGRFSSRKSA